MARQVIDIRGADKIMRLLRDLPKQLTAGKTGGVVAKALRKGARVLINEEKKTLQAAIDVGKVYSTGQLIKKLTVKRVAKHDEKGEKVQTSIRKGKYKTKADGTPRTGKKSQPTYYAVGSFLEYGTSTQPATPWVRPAFNAKAAEAILTTEKTLLTSLEKIAAKNLPRER